MDGQMQVDAGVVIDSLARQVGEQARHIAVLEATVAAHRAAAAVAVIEKEESDG